MKNQIKQPRHYGDVGPAIAEADYKPRISGNPEETLGLIFARLGRDYGGPLPADFVLRTAAATKWTADQRATVGRRLVP